MLLSRRALPAHYPSIRARARPSVFKQAQDIEARHKCRDPLAHQRAHDTATALFGPAALRFAESPRPNRQQHTLGDAAGPFADPAHLGVRSARVDLDDLRLYADRHAITGEAAKESIKRCRQGHRANLSNRLTLPNFITDTGFCAEDAVEGSVDVPVAGMPGDLPRLTSEDPGCAVRDDGAQPFPTRLDHHIGVSSGHELWAERNRQRSEFALDFRCRVLAHSGIH